MCLDTKVMVVYNGVMATTHRLLTKEPATRTGMCSECGSTRIARKGAYWRCAGVNAARVSTWRHANPVQARAHRRRSTARWRQKPRAHELLARDMGTLTGECAECGPVSIVRYGRGWMCGSRQGCRCEDEVRWAYTTAGVALCEPCCYALARGFVQEGLLEPVIEMTWPESRVSWDQAARELEAA